MKVYVMQFMKSLAYSEQKILQERFPELALKTSGKPFFIAGEGTPSPKALKLERVKARDSAA